MNKFIYEMDGSLLFMIVAVVILLYQVYMVDRVDITELKKFHVEAKKEGFGNGLNSGLFVNSGANREQGMFSSGQWEPGYSRIQPTTSGSSGFLGPRDGGYQDSSQLLRTNSDATGYTTEGFWEKAEGFDAKNAQYNNAVNSLY